MLTGVDGSAGEEVFGLVVLSKQGESLAHKVAEGGALHRQLLDKVANKHGLQVSVKEGSASYKPGLPVLCIAAEETQVADHAMSQHCGNGLQRAKRCQPVLFREVGRVNSCVVTQA